MGHNYVASTPGSLLFVRGEPGTENRVYAVLYYHGHTDSLFLLVYTSYCRSVPLGAP